MKGSLVFLTTVLFFAFTHAASRAPSPSGCENFERNRDRDVTKCFISSCSRAITQHIKYELDASFSYLFLAAHFDDDQLGRPGLAKFLYESASEERDHAILMLSYLDRRGAAYTQSYSFDLARDFPYYHPGRYTYDEVLDVAVQMEMVVTELLDKVIQQCSDDFDAADFFTEPIIAEQYDGMRKLRGAVTTLSDLKAGSAHSSAIAEFILDQKILKHGL